PSEPGGDLDPGPLEGRELPAHARDAAHRTAPLADEEAHRVEELGDVLALRLVGPGAAGAPLEAAAHVVAEVLLGSGGLGERRRAAGLALLLGEVLVAEDRRDVRRPLEGGVVLALGPGLGEAHRLPAVAVKALELEREGALEVEDHVVADVALAVEGG